MTVDTSTEAIKALAERLDDFADDLPREVDDDAGMIQKAADALLAVMQRAEAAEAKLAEVERERDDLIARHGELIERIYTLQPKLAAALAQVETLRGVLEAISKLPGFKARQVAAAALAATPAPGEGAGADVLRAAINYALDEMGAGDCYYWLHSWRDGDPEPMSELEDYMRKPAPPAPSTGGDWRLCPSTHCARRQECASPHECSGTGKRAALRAALAATPAPAIDPQRDADRALKDALFACLKGNRTTAQYGGVRMSPAGDMAWVRFSIEPATPAPEGKDASRPLPIPRDELGRMVREAWVRWALTQENPKPSWLVPYDELAEPDKEADRQIGEAVARWTLIHDAALAATPAPEGEKS